MLLLTAETFPDCLKIESTLNKLDSTALKFLRFGKEVFVESSNYYHSALLAGLGRRRDELDDAGYLQLSVIDSKYYAFVLLDSDSLNFVPSEEQRAYTVEVVAQTLLGIAHVIGRNK